MERKSLHFDGANKHTELSVYSRTGGMILAVKGEMARAQIELTNAADMRKLAGFLLARAQRLDPLPDTTTVPVLAPDQLT